MRVPERPQPALGHRARHAVPLRICDALATAVGHVRPLRVVLGVTLSRGESPESRLQPVAYRMRARGSLTGVPSTNIPRIHESVALRRDPRGDEFPALCRGAR